MSLKRNFLSHPPPLNPTRKRKDNLMKLVSGVIQTFFLTILSSMAKVLLWVSQVVLKPTRARTHTQGKHLANMMLSTHWSLHPGMLLLQLWQIFLSSTELRWLCSLLCCPEVSSVPLRNYCWHYRHLCLLHLRRYTRYRSIHWQCVYVRWQCYSWLCLAELKNSFLDFCLVNFVVCSRELLGAGFFQ